MNMFKKNGGFTLVELIVVIAILAILAGVAVPAYSGYIENANKAADEQKLEAIETAMSAALSMAGKDASAADKYFTATYASNELAVTQNTTSEPSDSDTVWANFLQFYGKTECKVTLSYYNAKTGASGAGDHALPKLLDVLSVG